MRIGKGLMLIRFIIPGKRGLLLVSNIQSLFRGIPGHKISHGVHTASLLLQDFGIAAFT